MPELWLEIILSFLRPFMALPKATFTLTLCCLFAAAFFGFMGVAAALVFASESCTHHIFSFAWSVAPK